MGGTLRRVRWAQQGLHAQDVPALPSAPAQGTGNLGHYFTRSRWRVMVIGATTSCCLGGSQSFPEGAGRPRNLFSEESELQQELPQTMGSVSSWLSPLLRAPGWRAGQGSGPAR